VTCALRSVEAPFTAQWTLSKYGPTATIFRSDDILADGQSKRPARSSSRVKRDHRERRLAIKCAALGVRGGVERVRETRR
jgi:hypothetical protein